jgi:hypothetical protein
LYKKEQAVIRREKAEAEAKAKAKAKEEALEKKRIEELERFILPPEFDNCKDGSAQAFIDIISSNTLTELLKDHKSSCEDYEDEGITIISCMKKWIQSLAHDYVLMEKVKKFETLKTLEDLVYLIENTEVMDNFWFLDLRRELYNIDHYDIDCDIEGSGLKILDMFIFLEIVDY